MNALELAQLRERHGPVRLPSGPPPTPRDALRRLEAVRTFEQLVEWSHELRASGLLDEAGETAPVRFWGALSPDEVPPQAVSLGAGDLRLPSGEVVSYTGNWKHGQWRLRARAELAA